MKLSALAAGAQATVLLLGATWAQAAVLNGSFERGINPVGSTIVQAGESGIDSWVVESAVEYVDEFWQASEGSRSVDLQAFTGEAGQITQVIDTIPGVRYTVSFDLAGNPFGTGVVEMQASADTVTRNFTFDVTRRSPNDMGWERQTFEFDAVGLEANLSFASLSPNTPLGAVIDNVSVSARDPCAGFVACFQDVPDSYWSASQIETIADLGITSGCDETHYCPTDPVDRAQMAVFVERGMRGGGYDPGPGVGNIFEDVPAGYWAGGWIELLFMDGITGGCDATHYCPSQLTTRAEMAVFLLRAKYGMDYAPPTPVGVFNDVAVTYWAAGWIEQLAAEGITSGCGGGNYCPADPVNRDQMAVFLVNTFQLQ